jgi:mannitol-1-/sugar-/sorbitol-6-/2-deoxyglucose-6-phosphatase
MNTQQLSMRADAPHLPPAVIFDMDGLLVETEPIWEVAQTELLAARGKILEPEVRNHCIGMRMADIMAHFQRVYQLADSVPFLAEELTQRMVDHLRREVTGKEGAEELLTFLHENAIPCAIASSSPHPLIDAVVDHLNWHDRFVVRCSGNDVPHGKPAPDVYLLTAQKMGFDPHDCLALEDSPTGARAAVAAGMLCYVVPNPEANQRAFDTLTPHRFSSLSVVKAHLQTKPR